MSIEKMLNWLPKTLDAYIWSSSVVMTIADFVEHNKGFLSLAISWASFLIIRFITTWRKEAREERLLLQKMTFEQAKQDQELRQDQEKHLLEIRRLKAELKKLENENNQDSSISL